MYQSKNRTDKKNRTNRTNRADREAYYYKLIISYVSIKLINQNYKEIINTLFDKFKILKTKKNRQWFDSEIAIKLVDIEEKNNGKLPDDIQAIVNEIILEIM